MYKHYGKKMSCLICKKQSYYYPSALKRKKTKYHFCSNKCHGLWMKTSQIGKNNPIWKGGKRIRNGYIQILCPEHPFADSAGYIFQHRLVVEKKLGRILTKKEIIHHVNNIKIDNRIKNLELTNSKKHSSLHHAGIKHNKNQTHLAKPIPFPS